MSTYVTGDKHGEHSIQTLSHANWKEGKELTRDDHLIIAGDFGLLFNNVPTPTELYWLDWLNDKPWRTLVVDGNHENHPMLNDLPRINWCGGEVGIIRDNIYHLRRGEIFTINNKKYFVFGGARSEDKMYRKEHISWWKEELPSTGEIMRGYENLKAHNFKVDYIITHTAPFEVIAKHPVELNVMNPDRYGLIDFFDAIAQEVEFKHYYFGHFHKDIKLDKKFTAVYHKNIKVED